jgi:outer membrane protein assembly factor BamD (BamD/ComL family)
MHSAIRRGFLAAIWVAAALLAAHVVFAEDPNVAEGYNLFLKSKYVDALDLVERYIREHPQAKNADAAKALHIEGRCMWGLGKYKEAVEILEKHLREFPTDRFCADSALFISTAYYRTRLSSMIGAAKRTMHDYPGSFRAKQALWWLPIAAKNALDRQDIALAYAERYINLYPDEKDANNMGTQYYRLGDYCAVLGDYAKSAEYYKKYLDAYPEGIFVPIAAARYRDIKHKAKKQADIEWGVLQKKSVAGGIVWDDRALKDPSTVLGMQALELSLGLAQQGKVSLGRATKETKAFLALHPQLEADKRAQVRLELAKALLTNGKRDEARKELEAIRTEFPRTKSGEAAQRELEEMK